MKTYIFKQESALTSGAYLTGHAAWIQDHWLDRAELEVTPPATGQCVIQLELGGTLQERVKFTIGPGETRWRSMLPLKQLLTGGQWVRWKVVSFTGNSGDEATNARITLYLGQDDFARALKPVERLEVRWVSGCGQLTLWTYDRETHAFAEVMEGLADGRASIEIEASIMRILIQNEVVLTAGSGVLTAGRYRSGASRTEPRLEFWVGHRRVGTLHADGLLAAPNFKEETEVTDGGAFIFRGSTGDPVAHLGRTGLTALELQDGL